MRADRHQVLDQIFGTRARADFTAAAAPLRAIDRDRSAFDIAAVSDGDEDVLFDDQVLDREIALGLDNLRFALVGELFANICKLFCDYSHLLALVAEDLAQAFDGLLRLLVLGLDFSAFERSQAPQGQVENRLRLNLRNP